MGDWTDVVFFLLLQDYYTHCHDLPPQLGGCEFNGDDEQVTYTAEIDGTDASSWRSVSFNHVRAISLTCLYCFVYLLQAAAETPEGRIQRGAVVGRRRKRAPGSTRSR